MIQFDHVRKTYPAAGGRRVVLRDCSFSIAKGQNLAIIGPNGAGKSTLIRMVSGNELPDSGQIIRNARISWPLGFTGGFHWSLTGRQNTRFVAKLYGCDEHELIDFVQDFAELGAYFDEPLKVYSAGMKARLSFGVSMGIRFDTYLIDEGMSFGDQRFHAKYTEAFEARRNDANVLMVAHQGSLLRQYCNVGAILWNGHLEFFPTIGAALDAYDELLAEMPSDRQSR